MTAPFLPRAHVYVGLFLVALATLMFEVLLTRIFSVTMWYHYSFMAISIAMFGMTVGAVCVYLLPDTFTPERAPRQLAVSAALFAAGVVIAFLVHANTPVFRAPGEVDPLAIALTYTILALPFFFSGITVSVALTKFAGGASALYAADLAGAALGCVLLVAVLELTDGPTAVFVVATLGGVSAVAFAIGANSRLLAWASLLLVLLLGAFAVAHTVLVREGAPFVRLQWVKGRFEPRPLHERWNSFSRVTVMGDIDTPTGPFGWGFSPKLPSHLALRQLLVLIDGSAGTPMTEFDGHLERLEHLPYDIVNLVHHVQKDADVLVVGAGGGRDILSALYFDQRSVTGVEINDAILEAVRYVFGNFTGHFDRDPRVRLVNDEARSFIARAENAFDVIQISLIDTWAATAAGAFALTENSLYTVEAWQTFLAHLTPRGILSVARWYFRGLPGEMYRLVALAREALVREGARDPRQHLLVARVMRVAGGVDGQSPDGVGVMLLAKSPLPPAQVAAFEATCATLGFELVLTPNYAEDAVFEALASPASPEPVLASLPLDVRAPTDDRPFFFHMLRFADVLYGQAPPDQGVVSFNLKAVSALGTLLVTVLALTGLCILLPLGLSLRRRTRDTLAGSAPLFAFFAAIGFGFMLVEISQMQRLVVFLGHPVYSLSVVLFTLLLASGVGSALTRRVAPADGLRPLAVLLGVLVLFGGLTPLATSAMAPATTPVRIALAALLLAPVGLFLGMAFPLGLKLASTHWTRLTPWLWGVNGATSVLASVLSVVLALAAGISAAFWTGVACYGAAFLAYDVVRRRIGAASSS